MENNNDVPEGLNVMMWLEWCMGWVVLDLVCPACGYEYVLVRPVGPTYPSCCDSCGIVISEAPLLPGDGLWMREDPQIEEYTNYETDCRKGE